MRTKMKKSNNTKKYETKSLTQIYYMSMIYFIVISGTIAYSQEPPAGMPPQAVRVDPAQLENLQNHQFVTGELRPSRRSNVAAQEAGQVKELFVKEGHTLQKGDLIATLDSKRLEIQKLEAEANLQVLQARFSEYQAQLELDQWQFEAFTKLSEQGSSHENELRQAKSAMMITQTRLLQNEKQVEVIKAQIDLLNQRLADSKIEAPFDAAVVKLNTEIGQWLNVGDSVVEIVSVGKIDAWLEIPERLTTALALQDFDIEINIEAINANYQLTSPRILQDINPTTRTFSLIATIDDPQTRLKPGMSITGWIPTSKKKDYITVSDNAIRRNVIGTYVFVAQQMPQSPIASAVPMVTNVLFHAGNRVAIDSAAIQPGDLLVVEGNERLMPGMPIMISAVSNNPPNQSEKSN